MRLLVRFVPNGEECGAPSGPELQRGLEQELVPVVGLVVEVGVRHSGRRTMLSWAPVHEVLHRRPVKQLLQEPQSARQLEQVAKNQDTQFHLMVANERPKNGGLD